jgi:NADH-quinone oxidoreductase subunit D
MNRSCEVRTQEMVLNVGPQHPSTHGVLRVVATLDGERVVRAEMRLGYLHRGIEKICETLEYPRLIPLFDRMDYVANLNNELSLVMAVERLAGLAVPPRAEYLRVITLEMNRLLSHIIWYGAFFNDIGLFGTAMLYAFREREYIQRIMELLTGARMHYNYFRYGGVALDAPEGFTERVREFTGRFPGVIDEFERLVEENEIVRMRIIGVGVLPQDMAAAWAVSGPMARASGIDFDLRRDEPYSVYPELDFEVPVRGGGDCYDRYLVRMEEMRQSVRLIRQALDKLPAGPVQGEVPKRLKVPEGETYLRTEHPKGEFGVYLVSDGGFRPYRLKVRSPSFVNLQAGAQIMSGLLVPDFVATLGSVDIVMGCVDR